MVLLFHNVFLQPFLQCVKMSIYGGKGYNTIPIADDKINVIEKLKFAFRRVENNVGK